MMVAILFWCSARDTYIILDSYNAGHCISNFVHVHLKYILAHLQTEGHVKKSVSAFMIIKRG